MKKTATTAKTKLAAKAAKTVPETLARRTVDLRSLRASGLPEASKRQPPPADVAAAPVRPGSGKRQKLFGHTVTGALLWMGSKGFSFDQATAALAANGV